MSADTEQPEEPHEPCPTPLGWQQVLAAFREESVVEQFAQSGLRWSVRRWGTGPTLIFLPGAVGDSELFALTAYLLKDEYTCLLLDYPESRSLPRATAGHRTLESLRQFVADQPKPAYAYGSGFGGHLLLRLLADPPARLQAAVVQCGYARARLSVFERLVLFASRFTSGELRQIGRAAGMLERNHRGWFAPYDPSRWNFLEDRLLSTPIAEAVRRLQISSDRRLEPALAAIKTPTLVLQAEGDGRLATARQQDLVDRIPNVVNEWLHTTGQYPYVTHPHRLVKILKAFFSADAEPQPTEEHQSAGTAHHARSV